MLALILITALALSSDIASGNVCETKFLGDLPTHPATSCQQVFDMNPNPKSRSYWIQDGCCPTRVYCNMDNTTGCGGGVWTRIAAVNMTIPSSECPRGLEKVKSRRNYCRKTVASGCSSVTFSTYGIPYKKVCGMITAYQYGSPDAFWPYHTHRTYTLDDAYADGVLVSYNSPPREHIWTFAAQPDGYHKNLVNGCPCPSKIRRFAGTTPRFIGEDFFCETSVHTGTHTARYYYENRLWDGTGCGTFDSGCEGTRTPWFIKSFPYSIESSVEVRVCLDEGREMEDIGIQQLYLYVQ